MGGIKGPLKKLTGFFKEVKCYVKIVANFYRCIFYYVLDIVKYMFFFFPILGYSMISKTSVVRNTQRLNYLLRWDIKTLNRCYLCKKKKKKKNALTFWQKLQREGFGKGGKNSSSHGFYYFLLFILLTLFIGINITQIIIYIKALFDTTTKDSTQYIDPGNDA
jgi:hypothetical protein